MKGKKHLAHHSGMRGGEKTPDPETAGGAHDAAPVAKPSDKPAGAETADAKSPDAFLSGMRGAEKPAAGAQSTVAEIAQGLQPGTNLEGAAQGLSPEQTPVIDAGDHFKISKAHAVDMGDHYKVMKQPAAKV